MGTKQVADLPEELVARLAAVLSELDAPQALRVAMGAAIAAHAMQVQPGAYDVSDREYEADAIVERGTVTIIVRAL